MSTAAICELAHNFFYVDDLVLELTIPRHLDIFADHEGVCALLNALSQQVLVEGGRVMLRFHNLQSTKPSALLCLAAATQAARRFGGEHSVNGTFPVDRDARRVLDEAGFYTLLNVRERPAVGVRRRVEWIEHLTGSSTDGQQVQVLWDKLFGVGRGLHEEALKQIYIGLTEAMNNVVQHAYEIGGRNALRFIRNRWWLTGNIDRSRGTFTFAICDLGMGIPKTLKTRLDGYNSADQLRFNDVNSKTDGELLQLALLLGQTSTELPWRGKGLRQMRGVVDAIGGRLALASGYGTCIYQGGVSSCEVHGHPLVGTLVEWTVPLRNVLMRG